jgi:hypothetical protein
VIPLTGTGKINPRHREKKEKEKWRTTITLLAERWRGLGAEEDDRKKIVPFPI